jgi:protocatechuate 3,4-dioxygenase beta subunit
MERQSLTTRTRRDVLWAGLAMPAAFALAPSLSRVFWNWGPEVFAGESVRSPTPACGEADGLTPSQTEGPYYKPRSPERRSLLDPDIAGTPIVLTGTVLSRRCQPIAGALVDFWQADDAGKYDNRGYRLRGHQFADDAGHYRLETIVPGLYPGRTRHIHVKVQAPNRPILTTQLYFPGEPRNRTDRIFKADLLLAVQDAADGKSATFDFILDMA